MRRNRSPIAHVAKAHVSPSAFSATTIMLDTALLEVRDTAMTTAHRRGQRAITMAKSANLMGSPRLVRSGKSRSTNRLSRAFYDSMCTFMLGSALNAVSYMQCSGFTMMSTSLPRECTYHTHICRSSCYCEVSAARGSEGRKAERLFCIQS